VKFIKEPLMGGIFNYQMGNTLKKNGPNEDFGDFTEDQLEYLTKRFKMKDKCCGTCKFWHRTGPTSGICKALVVENGCSALGSNSGKLL
jgi:hypothetical protein